MCTMTSPRPQDEIPRNQNIPTRGSCKRCMALAKFLLQQFEKFQEIHNLVDVYVEQSILSSHILTGLINDLMDHAKMEASTFQLDNEYFSMFEVLKTTFGVMSFDAQNKKIRLQIEFDISHAFIFMKLFGDRRRF